MKKLIGLALTILVGLGILYLVKRPQTEALSSLNGKDLKIRSIGKANESDYAIRLKILFKQSGIPDREMVNFEGVLTQFTPSEGVFSTEWKTIGRYSIESAPVTDELIGSIVGKQSLTQFENGRSDHSLSPDFPSVFLRSQLMILDRFFINVPLDSAQTLTREESDDQVPFTAEYSFSQDDGVSVITKKWVSYLNPASSIDPAAQSIRYFFDENQRMLAAEGQVRSYFKDQGESELLIEFSAEAIETRPASDRIRSINTQSLRAANAEWLNDAVVQNRASASSFAEAMKDVETLTENTESEKTYEVFRSLTDQVRADPDVSVQIAKRILEIKERDPSSRRKLSAMFGALAESRHPEGADTLAELAKDCPDNYCKVQAIMGVNTHAQPSLTNTDSMLTIARTSSDKEVAATALIAAGAVGRKLDVENPDLTRELIQSYNDPKKSEMKTSTLAAMGNHGSTEYYPTLAEGLRSEDSSIRSASVYSLRYLPNEQVNREIIQVIDNEKISSVVSEAIKAAAFRKLKPEEYNHIANRAGDFKNKELAEQAANVLAEVYRSNPSIGQEALTLLREKTKYPDVKKYIDSQLKPVERKSP